MLIILLPLFNISFAQVYKRRPAHWLWWINTICFTTVLLDNFAFFLDTWITITLPGVDFHKDTLHTHKAGLLAAVVFVNIATIVAAGQRLPWITSQIAVNILLLVVSLALILVRVPPPPPGYPTIAGVLTIFINTILLMLLLFLEARVLTKIQLKSYFIFGSSKSRTKALK
jgi:hypothetical protein